MNKFTSKKFVFSFLKENLLLTIILLLFILLCALSGLLPPFLLRYLIDTYIPGFIGNGNTDYVSLSLFSLLYFFSYFLVGFFEVAENYLITLFGQKMIHSLRYEMIRKTHRMKANYFTHHGTGEIQSRIMDDVYSIETLFASGIVSLLVSFVKIIGILVSIFTFSWMLGIIVFLLIPLIYLLTRKISKIMFQANIKNKKSTNLQANLISETINNMEIVQLLNKEQYRQDIYEDEVKKSYGYKDKTAWLDALFSPVVELIKALLISLVSLLVYLSLKNDNAILSFGISAGTFAASMTLISNLFSPLQNIGKEIQTMQDGISGVHRVEEFMNEKEINEKDSLLTYEKIFSDPKEDFLTFDHLSFQYDDGEEKVFSDLNFTIKEKEKVIFVGRTGAGKTTLFKLILGLENPTEGKILLNGQDVSLIRDSEKRKIYGYVEQGFSSIEGTIMEQITLKDEHYTLDDVRKVMKIVSLDDYVQNHIPSGYDAKFSMDDFSRGQLQLLCLARALLSNPKILLLDEISANLDSRMEMEIIDAISRCMKDRTVISISHRLSDQLGFERTIEIS